MGAIRWAYRWCLKSDCYENSIICDCFFPHNKTPKVFCPTFGVRYIGIPSLHFFIRVLGFSNSRLVDDYFVCLAVVHQVDGCGVGRGLGGALVLDDVHGTAVAVADCELLPFGGNTGV